MQQYCMEKAEVRHSDGYAEGVLVSAGSKQWFGLWVSTCADRLGDLLRMTRLVWSWSAAWVHWHVMSLDQYSIWLWECAPSELFAGTVCDQHSVEHCQALCAASKGQLYTCQQVAWAVGCGWWCVVLWVICAQQVDITSTAGCQVLQAGGHDTANILQMATMAQQDGQLPGEWWLLC